MAYSWTPDEALDLLIREGYTQIIGSPQRNNVNIKCPLCGGKRAFYERATGRWCCNSAGCKKGGDSANLCAIAWDMPIIQARRTIEDKLGIKKDWSGNVIQRPPREVVKFKEKKNEPLAPPEVLDATYRAFLAELTLSDKNKTHLLSRGFSEERIEALGYKTFPSKSEISYKSLCRRLMMNGYTLKGVPGFFPDKFHPNEWSFVSFTKGIIMPRVNRENLIVGLQIRKDDDLRVATTLPDGDTEIESKCVWFSSKGFEGGCGAKPGIHYACDFIMNRLTKTYEPVLNTKGLKGVMLTEGIMKGDLSFQIMPNMPVIANQGVAMLEDLESELLFLKQKAGLEVVALAYDMDYRSNVEVQRALKKAEEIIEKCGLKIKKMDWETNVTVNDKSFVLKGIDDYLAFYKLGIIPTII